MVYINDIKQRNLAMNSPKLTTMISILSKKLSEKDVPFCLIGALALGFYGLPRYTADIDIMAEEKDWPPISSCFIEAGYTCYNKTVMFAQFDSELNVFGKVDVMFVATDEGKDMIRRSVIIHDDVMGMIPVIQPSDYLILKIMAIANDPSRKAHDEGDIAEFIKLYSTNRINHLFDPLDPKRILSYAARFGQESWVSTYLSSQSNPSNKGNPFNL